MSGETSGVPAHATLDGYVVAAGAEWEIREQELKGNHRAAGGRLREQRAWNGGPAYPAIISKHVFTLDYGHLGRHAAPVMDRLAFPGPHLLCVWKHFPLGYYGDGVQKDFLLPALWRVAPDSLVPPLGLSADRFASEVLVGFEAALLAVFVKTTVDYDAGNPVAGQAWFEQGGVRFKLGTAPAPDAQVCVRVVPLFQVLTAAAESDRRYSDPVREPRRLVFEEM